MPIIWRYLAKDFIKVFLLSVSSFIAILLITRIQDIAKFASFSVSPLEILTFTVYQIPYILPFAIPISCLISSTLLMQKLSKTHEITAMRSSGIPLKVIFTPVLLISLFIALCNGIIIGEISPRCRLLSTKLLYETTSLNPLFMMKKNKLLRFKDSYVDLKTLRIGKEAEDFLIAVCNSSTNRLSLTVAKSIKMQENFLRGEEVSFISSLPAKESNHFDSLMIDNQKSIMTPIESLSKFLQKSSVRVGTEHMPTKMLLSKIQTSHTTSEKKLKRKTHYELYRRFFFPLATLSLTYLGLSYGIEISRSSKNKGGKKIIFFTAFAFICFMAAKSFYLKPVISALFYIVIPHSVLFAFSYRQQGKIQKGIE